MKDILDSWIKNAFENNLSQRSAQILAELVYLFLGILLASLLYVIAKYIILKTLKKAARRTKTKADDLFFENKGTYYLISLAPALTLYFILPLMPTLQKYVEVLLSIFTILMSVLAVNSYLDLLNTFYEKKRNAARQRPIKGIIKTVKIILMIFAVIIIISRLLGQSPLLILSGLGAASAILLLIFKDAILGMVAGVQIAYNDLVRVGDWIEMPKYGADGDVAEITVTVVKVINFDKTITTIPAYALVSDSFKNWRGMQNSGGRRIKRAINIDVSSIAFCTAKQLEEFCKVSYLKEYIIGRQEEIDAFNKERGVDTACPVNGRRQTNIGVFRRYVKEYLDRHPGIHRNMIKMVRQLATENMGLPLEVYAFTNTTRWEDYEGIMADIFDHLYAVLPYFGLRAYQQPAGFDLQKRGELTDGPKGAPW
jgi:miniconductance mechanosensitive channel